MPMPIKSKLHVLKYSDTCREMGMFSTQQLLISVAGTVVMSSNNATQSGTVAAITVSLGYFTIN